MQKTFLVQSTSLFVENKGPQPGKAQGTQAPGPSGVLLRPSTPQASSFPPCTRRDVRRERLWLTGRRNIELDRDRLLSGLLVRQEPHATRHALNRVVNDVAFVIPVNGAALFPPGST